MGRAAGLRVPRGLVGPPPAPAYLKTGGKTLTQSCCSDNQSYWAPKSLEILMFVCLHKDANNAATQISVVLLVTSLIAIKLVVDVYNECI